MKVKELITKLQEINPEWFIRGTINGNLTAWEDYDTLKPGDHIGRAWAHIFLDDRETKFKHHRQ
jgi:hypothetical protein